MERCGQEMDIRKMSHKGDGRLEPMHSQLVKKKWVKQLRCHFLGNNPVTAEPRDSEKIARDSEQHGDSTQESWLC